MTQLKPILERGKLGSDQVEDKVKEIIAQVRKRGDEALLEYTRRFDNLKLTSPAELKISEVEIKKAYKEVSSEEKKVLETAIGRIRNYHRKQLRQSWFMNEDEGIVLGQLIRPLQRAGVYVPGGKAAYPSSVLMNVIPAQVAGVDEIVICSPADLEGNLNPFVLVAADLLGIANIFRIGGAQAIAAMAHGTPTVPQVDKIAGPGNIYVATAKSLVYGEVGIDMVAGPSEILVIADNSAQANFVAADLLSQAEHDELASSILLTPCADLAQAVEKEIKKQLKNLTRREIAESSWKEYGAIVITKNIDEAISIANQIAPEHLELALDKPQEVLDKVRNAGAVFMGHYTPEPIGDYLAGPNHVLPTGGSARFASPLGVDDFIKKTSLIGYSKTALKKQASIAARLARMEGLSAHLNAIKQRLD